MRHLTKRHRSEPAEGCEPGGLPTGVWLNLGINAAGVTAVAILAAVEDRLPRRTSSPTWIAKSVLVFTVVIVVWTSVIVPPLPMAVVDGSLREQVVLTASAVATTVVAMASWSAHWRQPTGQLNLRGRRLTP